MEEKLHLGKMSYSQLAKWFHIGAGTLANAKDRYLKKLKYYADFEIINHKIYIKEIYCDTYCKEREMSEIYLQQVKKAPHFLTSLTGMAELIQMENPQEADKSIRGLTARLKAGGDYGFGSTIEEDSMGVYGCRNYIWAVKLGVNKYRYFTEEEEKWVNDTIQEFYGVRITPSQIQNLALLDEALKHKEIDVDTYFNKKTMLKLNFFDAIVSKFKDKFHVQMVRATEHQIKKEYLDDIAATE